MHIFVGLKRTWGQKLSSGRMMSGQLSSALTGLMSLTFMTVHFFLVSFAGSEQYCLFILSFFKTWAQKLSSGFLLKFMTTQLFQFHFAFVFLRRPGAGAA